MWCTHTCIYNMYIYIYNISFILAILEPWGFASSFQLNSPVARTGYEALSHSGDFGWKSRVSHVHQSRQSRNMFVVSWDVWRCSWLHRHKQKHNDQLQLHPDTGIEHIGCCCCCCCCCCCAYIGSTKLLLKSVEPIYCTYWVNFLTFHPWRCTMSSRGHLASESSWSTLRLLTLLSEPFVACKDVVLLRCRCGGHWKSASVHTFGVKIAELTVYILISCSRVWSH